MAKRRRKYFVDLPDAIQFLRDAYGMKTRVVNYYHLKVYQPDFKGSFNWFHTQGTLTVETDNYNASVGSTGDVEEMAIMVNSYVNEKNK